MTTPPRLELRSLSKRFGGLQAVSDMSFAVHRGEIFGLIGPNGAGKTTLFNLIAGVHKPTGGEVLHDGIDVTGQGIDVIARRGIGRTFQAAHTFKLETVRENLRRAALLQRSYAPWVHFWGPRGRSERENEEKAHQVAAFVGITGQMDQAGGALPYGQQKMLGVAMALMTSPSLLLMDEPAAGLNPTEKLAMGTLIRRLRDERGIDILLVEHDMRLVMSLSDRILVINQGRKIALGSPEAVQADPAVIEAYLGGDHELA
ncbi:ABC transporter ATP-binding protein [Ottowia thiooxydans]|uniref:ABC transporter ATP-binding protein n=1 Tax=Ottowia thiooxydans TaxID=219182 RepID=UPI0004235016|nr:ABC transporter ATP-binding protein [Ottowia thiooxydans]